MDASAPEVDAEIRKAGWHFMWITASHTARGLGRTPEIALHRALVRALGKVRGRFNAAEAGAFHMASFLGLRMATITIQARHIQKQATLDSDEDTQLQEVVAL